MRAAKHPVVAVVALPRLASEVLGARAPGPRGIVVDELEDGSFVLRSVLTLVDASDDARAAGVRPGQRVLDAQLYAPTLALDVVARTALERELRSVAEALLACSPIVQPFLPAIWSGLPMAAVALDLTGMARPLARIVVDVQRICAHLGHRAVVAASPGTRLSFALARSLARAHGRSGRDVIVVKRNEVAAALTRLSLDALGLSIDMAAQLAALGARSAADVGKLLDKGGIARLGNEARAVIDVISARYQPLRSIVPPERLVEDIDLEHPVVDVEPLAFILGNLSARLCLRARGRGARIGEVELRLLRNHRRGEPKLVAVAFPDALLDDKALLRALRVRLERDCVGVDGGALGGPVDRVQLEAMRMTRRAARQLPLEKGAAGVVRADDALEGLLAEMSAELGSERVGCLVVTDEPLPERMTRLAWPAPPPPARPPAPERRRPRKVAPLPSSSVTSGGRFLAAWPWPVRLLPRPIRLGDVRVIRQEALGVLEGDDRHDRPYAREYRLLVFDDGRRALALHDEELQELWLHGWFD